MVHYYFNSYYYTYYTMIYASWVAVDGGSKVLWNRLMSNGMIAIISTHGIILPIFELCRDMLDWQHYQIVSASNSIAKLLLSLCCKNSITSFLASIQNWHASLSRNV